MDNFLFRRAFDSSQFFLPAGLHPLHLGLKWHGLAFVMLVGRVKTAATQLTYMVLSEHGITHVLVVNLVPPIWMKSLGSIKC